MAPIDIQITRQKTIETVRSRLGSVYSQSVVGVDGQDQNNRDGSEFKEIDPELVTWDGPDDPENPRNWPSKKKWLTTIIVGLYTMVSPLSSSIMSPAVPAISDAFGMSPFEGSLSISIFILAWAICPLFMAPISELFGRQVVLNSSIVLLLIFNVACGLAKNTGQLMVFRFIAGLAGAPPISVGAGTLADLFDDSERNTPMGLWSLGPNLGPVIAPIISGFIVEYTSWRWVFWVLSMINGTMAALGIFLLRESFAPVVLARKAKRLRKLTGNPNLHTVFEIAREPFHKRIFTAITRPIVMLFTNPIIIGLGFYMAFVYGFMYLMLVTFPALWTDIYHYTSGIAGLMYLGLGVGNLLSVIIWTPLTQAVYVHLTKKNNGVPKPEYRIFLAPLTAVILGVGLIWYGWSAQERIHWIMPCIGTGIFGIGLFPVFQCIQNYLIDMNPRFSASAVGAAAVFRSMFGFGFPLFGRAMYDKLGYGWANTLSGILMFVLGIPFPLFMYFYGERVRAWIDRQAEKKLEKK